ncbi:hypothetical protein MARA_39430 [Mycolicibacterium arabiense]|uniref:Uncharacterized protein n=1 Tax=Mycolicibacterium arabiense TaxID=1286181 RepID=A0A7I7S3E2_9MYCO|nr:hypothetical protein [Mycolicibacterium arabiense]MCV7371764.1 hypothetical protein [Mycolicibacterium arabiense]BBY50475.1 hypothetical protein MARA_39430 [Mycolicibacterium arabiense]
MSVDPPEHDDGGTPGARPTRTWLRAVDRLLWGVDAPVSDADRARRWKKFANDVADVAGWGNRRL